MIEKRDRECHKAEIVSAALNHAVRQAHIPALNGFARVGNAVTFRDTFSGALYRLTVEELP